MTDVSEHDDFAALLPEMADWGFPEGFGANDWIRAAGRYELAIGYSLIFWPRFVVIDGYVLRDGCTADHVRAWEKATPENRIAVEAMLNHVHIADIHEGHATEGQLRYLGRVLREIHEVKLKADYPDRTFIVSFPDEAGLDPVDYELTFWQSAPANQEAS